MNPFRKRPKILTQLRIDEISCVDRGAGDGVKIVLMKRDDPKETPPRTIEHLQERSKHAHQLDIRSRNADVAAEVDTPVVADSTSPGASHISHLADLLVETSEGKLSRAAALH